VVEIDGDLLLYATDRHLKDNVQTELCIVDLDTGGICAEAEITCGDFASVQVLNNCIFLCSSESGIIQQVDSPVNIYRKPKNQFVADFVGKVNFLKGVSADGWIRLDGIEDILPYDGDVTGKVDVAIRPENLRIIGGEAHLHGKIVSEFFMGDVNDCRVQIGEKELRVISDASTYGKFGREETIGLEISDFLVFIAAMPLLIASW
jgi:ABC-type Fe3+/spermidine/putrescine transport system ATPase subunit